MAFYVVDAAQARPGTAGRVLGVHRVLPIAVAACIMLTDLARERAAPVPKLRILYSYADLARGDHIAVDAVLHAYTSDGVAET
jgi:hypothetical protein